MTFFLEQRKTQKAQIKQQYKQKKEVLEKELKEVQAQNLNLSLQVAHFQEQADRNLQRKTSPLSHPPLKNSNQIDFFVRVSQQIHIFCTKSLSFISTYKQKKKVINAYKQMQAQHDQYLQS